VFRAIDLDRERRTAGVAEDEVAAARPAAVSQAAGLEQSVQRGLRREPVAGSGPESGWRPRLQERSLGIAAQEGLVGTGVDVESGVEDEGLPLDGHRQDGLGLHTQLCGQAIGVPADFGVVRAEFVHVVREAVDAQGRAFDIERCKGRLTSAQELEEKGAREAGVLGAVTRAATAGQQQALAENVLQSRIVAQAIVEDSRKRPDGHVFGHETGTRRSGTLGPFNGQLTGPS